MNDCLLAFAHLDKNPSEINGNIDALKGWISLDS